MDELIRFKMNKEEIEVLEKELKDLQSATVLPPHKQLMVYMLKRIITVYYNGEEA